MRTTRLAPMFVSLIVLMCNAALAMEDAYVVYCDPNATYSNGIPIYTNPQMRAWEVGRVNCGQQIKVLSVETDMIKIDNNGTVGYIESRYVRRLAPVSAQPVEPVYQMGRAPSTTPVPPPTTPPAPPPTITPQVVGSVVTSPSNQPTASAAASPEGPYLTKGMNELGLQGVVTIPHIDVDSTSAIVNVLYGRYLTDWFAIGPLFSATFAGSQVHSISAAGVAQFVPRISDRFYLVAGAGVGVNTVKAFEETDTNLLGTAYFGPRVFVARHVALDVEYNLLYRRITGLGFKDSSASSIVIGFSFIF